MCNGSGLGSASVPVILYSNNFATSYGVGGIPSIKKKSRRISVARSASRDGAGLCRVRLTSTKASTGVAGCDLPFSSDGTVASPALESPMRFDGIDLNRAVL